MKKILLVNPPHTAIGSRIPREQLPPLGLLSVGGPLIDAGYHVKRHGDGKPTLRGFWGGSLAAHEESMVKRKRPAIAIKAVKTEN